MNELSKELAMLKDRLLDRERELDARESALKLDLESLEKQKKELIVSDDLSARLTDFEARQGKDLSERK